MVKRAEIKEKLFATLKVELKRIKEGQINGLVTDFEIINIHFFELKILLPTEENIDDDNFEKAEMIEFTAEINVRIFENNVPKKESMYKCNGSAKTEFINNEFKVKIELISIRSILKG